MIAVVITELGALGWGLFIRRLLGCEASLKGWPVAWVMGSAAEMLILYLSSAGSQFYRGVPIALTVGGLMCLATWFWRSGPWSVPSLRSVLSRFAPIDILILAVLALPVAVLLFRGLYFPPAGWDGLAMWTAKAGFLIHGEGLRGEAFTDPARLNAHRGYPIGLPLLMSRNLAWSGSMDLILVARGLLAFASLMLVSLVAVVREVTGLRTALLTVALLLWAAPWVQGDRNYHLTSGFVDPIIGLVVAFAVCSLALWTVHRRYDALAAGIFACVILAGLKHEGLVWACIILSVGALSVLLAIPRPRRRDWALFLAAGTSVALLRLIHLHLPITGSLSVPSIQGVLAGSPNVAVDALHLIFVYILKLLFEHYFLVTASAIFSCLILGLGCLRCLRLSTRVLALIPVAWYAVIVAVLVLIHLQHRGVIGWFELVPRLLDQAFPVTLMLGVFLWATSKGGKDQGSR